MADSLKNWLVDPWNADALDHVHVQSVHYGGAFLELTAPAAANYPESSPTRYFLYTQWVIDVSDLAGSYPCIIYDHDTSTTLTRVTGAPGANEYRLPPSTSEGKNIIELHSGQAGHSIAYDFYVNGSVLRSKSGFLDTYSEYRNSTGTASSVLLKQKIIEIGDWNMNSLLTVTVTHGITDWKKIRNIGVIIRKDSDDLYYSFSFADSLSRCKINATSIILEETITGVFQVGDFNSTSYNRGYIFIVYED